jgi:hypothetical protein
MRWKSVVAVTRSALRFALCLVAVSVVATVATELCLRGFVEHPLPLGLLRTHSSRHFELTPGFRGQSYEADLFINSAGMRDEERSADPNAYRIAVFGDSFAFGQGVAADQTFPKQLEKKLQRDSGVPVQVFNFATPGLNTQAELSLLKDRYARFTPNLVIFQYTLGDDSIGMVESPWNKFRIIRQAKDLFRRLYTYDYLANRYYGFTGKNLRSAQTTESQVLESHYAEGYPGWIECQQAFEQLSRLAIETHFEVLFAVVSYNGYIVRSASDDVNAETVSKLFAALDRAGIHNHVLVDDALRQYWGRESHIQVRPGDNHFSAEGHALLGDFLAREVQKRRPL